MAAIFMHTKRRYGGNKHMKLIITEKYKTAQPFARLLGATNKSHVSFNKGNRGYFEGNGWCITWCMGHLIELCLPDQYGDEYKKWSLDNLPIVPKKWMYQPASGVNARYQLGVVKELLNRSDLECVYHAADADKEGELIVRELLTYFGKENVPAKRVWYTNTTDEALTKALAEAKPLSDYDGLAAAALARQQRDWIYGTNLTRAYTAYSHTLQNVGRVVSATINLIVQRQKEIDEFVPKEYGVVSALLDRDDKSFVAAAKYDDLKRAAEVERKIKGKVGRITGIDKTQSSTKRKLFDLTSLQAEAAKRFGYSATQTAAIVQTLYENGWMSYPRTNSNYINPEQIDETEPLLGEAHARIFSDMPIDDSDFDINRIVQAKGEGAEASHTGLCPTMQGLEDYASRIKGDDRLDSIFRLVAIRLVASCLPPYITEKTTVSVDIESEPFTAAGTGEIECPKPGVCLVDAAHAVAPQPDELPAVISEGQTGRRAVAGRVERLHFGQRNAVDGGGAVGDELVERAPLFPYFIEKPVERRAAQAVGIAHQERIVRLHPPAHPAEDVVQVELVLPCIMPSFWRATCIWKFHDPHVKHLERIMQIWRQFSCINISKEHQHSIRIEMPERCKKRYLYLHIYGMKQRRISPSATLRIETCFVLILFIKPCCYIIIATFHHFSFLHYYHLSLYLKCRSSFLF